MRKFVIIILVVIIAVVVIGGVASRPPQAALAATLMRPDQRVGDYAGLVVNLVNPTSADATNPQLRITVSLDGKDWSCQGYEDPTSGQPVVEAGDVIAQPLVIPAGKTMPVTILCRIPATPMDGAKIRLH